MQIAAMLQDSIDKFKSEQIIISKSNKSHTVLHTFTTRSYRAKTVLTKEPDTINKQ